MKQTIFLAKAKPPKKWVAIFPDGKRVSFGAAGYQDYTMHKDPARQRRYITRHEKHENWSDPRTAGFWSRWLLWSKPSFNEALKETRRHLQKYGLEVYKH
jgi:hypothetical protein